MVSMSSACCFFRTTVDGSVISCSSFNWTPWCLSISNTSVNHLQSSYLNIHASLVPITLLSNMLHYTWGSQQHHNLLYIQPWIMVLNDCRGTMLGMLCLLFHGLLVVGASLLLDISSPLADVKVQFGRYKMRILIYGLWPCTKKTFTPDDSHKEVGILWGLQPHQKAMWGGPGLINAKSNNEIQSSTKPT